MRLYSVDWDNSLVFSILRTVTFLSFSWMFFGVQVNASEEPVETVLEQDSLELFVDNIIIEYMDEHNVAGATVAITEGDKTVLVKGYGLADVENGIAVDPEKHLFRIASVSKLFVWTSVMQLVERGQLDLHADVNTYLDFKLPDAFGQSITLWHLMTHTPGFEDTHIDGSARTADDMVSLADALKNNIPARVIPPGVKSGYSNYGAALAGYIVERVSGMPYYKFVEKNIFEPLGMTRTTLRQFRDNPLLVDYVKGYDFDDGVYTEGPFDHMKRYPDGSGAATPGDMAKFAIAHIMGETENTGLMKPETMRQMHQIQFANIPQTAGLAMGFTQGRYNGYLTLGHGGDISYYTSKFLLFPEAKISIFISFNSGSVGSSTSLFVQKFMDRYFPAMSEDSVLFSDEPVAEATDEVSGQYVASRRNFSTIEKIVWPILTGVTVNRLSEEEIMVTFFGDDHIYKRLSEGVYVPSDDDHVAKAEVGTVIVTKDPETQRKNLYFSRFSTFFFEEPPAIEKLENHLILLGVVLICLVAGVFAVIMSWVQSPKNKAVHTGHVSRTSKRLCWSVVAMVVLVLCFFAGMPSVMNEEIIYGITSAQRLLFWIPLILLVLGFFSVGSLISIVREKSSSMLLVTGASLTVIGVSIFLWQLHIWNMIGTGAIPSL